MTEGNIRAGNFDNISGEVIIAGRDVVRGYTVQQVSALLTQISSTFQPKPFDGRCPYKGLGVFEEEDSELFFGRETLVKDLLSRVQGSRNLFITGPSGSGKSSLVRAGCIPACKSGGIRASKSEHWKYETIKLGREPLEALALAFGRLKSPELADYFRSNIGQTSVLNACAESVLSGRSDQRLVLFIDQFEEVFTQINREEDRLAFFTVLTDAIAVENGRVILLFAMRSDFVSNCAAYPALNALLNQQFVQIGAMQPPELVSAIAQPALRVGLRIDPDLIAQIIKDMGGEPGTLPLMQFALKDLFDEEQAKGGMIALTLSSYNARGGIHRSLERHADHAFQTLSEGEQELARSIFSSLIEIGRGTPDTGRTAWLEELTPAAAKPEQVELIVRKLADARLITTDEQSGRDLVTISHERLIDAWPWLRKLVNENRDVIALQNELAEDAAEWDRNGRDLSYLYHGARLVNAREKLEAQKLVLNGLSQAYLDSGIQAHQDELEAAQQRAAHLRKRNLYLRIALVTALLVGGIAAYLGVTAFSRQLAAQAMVLQEDKRDIAMLMSVQAYKLNNDFQTRSSLLSTLQCCSDGLIRFLSGHTDSVWDVVFSPDGTLLASAGNDGTILIWKMDDLSKPSQILQDDSTATIYTVAFSADGKTLAAGDGTGSILLYDTKDWQPAGTLRGHAASVLSVKFSNDSQWLVSGGADGKVIVWDLAEQSIVKRWINHKGWVWDVALSPDKQTVVSVGTDRIVRLRSMVNVTAARSRVLNSSNRAVTFVSIAFNEDRDPPMLVTGDASGYVVTWDLTPWNDGWELPKPGKLLPAGSLTSGDVWGLDFIPGDDLTIITGRDTGIINRNQVVAGSDVSENTLQRKTLGMTGNNFGVFRIDVSPDGTLIAAAGQDGLVSLWYAAEVPTLIRHPSSITSVQILNDDSATAMSVDGSGGLFRWDYGQYKKIKDLALDIKDEDKLVLESAISPDGTHVVTGYEDGMLVLWDGKSGLKRAEYKNHLVKIISLAFSPDGKHFASSDDDGNVILWKVTASRLELSARFVDPAEAPITVLSFSPDGKTLAAGGCAHLLPPSECSQGVIYTWSVRSPTPTLGTPSILPGKAGYTWSLAFNPTDPDELAVGTRDGTVTIWSLRAQDARLAVRLGKSDVTALVFSPDGELLVVGSEGYKIFMYNAHTGQKFGEAFRDHDDDVIALAFTADGNTLLSASLDSTVLIHTMDPAEWQARACRIANRNLTLEEWRVFVSNKLPYQEICPE